MTFPTVSGMTGGGDDATVPVLARLHLDGQ